MIWCQKCTKYLPDPAMTKLYDAKCLHWSTMNYLTHHNDVIMSAMVFQIIGVSIAYSTVCPGADQRKHQNPVTGVCEGNSPLTGKFPAQRASNAKNVSIWWHHHGITALPWKWHAQVYRMLYGLSMDTKTSVVTYHWFNFLWLFLA